MQRLNACVAMATVNLTLQNLIYTYIVNLYLFVYQWLYSPFLDLGRFVSVLIYTQSVGLVGRGISPSQGRYLHAEQHKQNKTHTDIHASSGIRTHDPSLREGKDGSCVRPRGHCGRRKLMLLDRNLP
jgi:hypothetical protein